MADRPVFKSFAELGQFRLELGERLPYKYVKGDTGPYIGVRMPKPLWSIYEVNAIRTDFLAGETTYVLGKFIRHEKEL